VQGGCAGFYASMKLRSPAPNAPRASGQGKGRAPPTPRISELNLSSDPSGKFLVGCEPVRVDISHTSMRRPSGEGTMTTRGAEQVFLGLLRRYISAFKDQTGSLFWGAWGTMQRGCLLVLTGKASDAVQTITSGVTAMRSTGTTMWIPLWLSYLTRANAEIGQFDEARRCI
jgi:hypothetical protein